MVKHRETLSDEEIRQVVTTAFDHLIEAHAATTIYDMDDEWSDLGMDSIDKIEFVMDIESHLNLQELDDDEVNSADTIAKLFELVVDAYPR